MKHPLYLILATAIAAPVLAESRPLIDFESPSQLQSVSNADSSHTLIDHNDSKALRVEMGTNKPYPNVTFKPASGSWDLAAFERVEIDVTNLTQESLKIGARADNLGASGRKNSTTGGVTLDPGETGTLKIAFNRKFAEEVREQLAGMHHSPWGARGESGGMIDPANVVSINVFVNNPVRPHTIVIDNIRATGDFNPTSLSVPEPFFPFIDRYGQYIHRDWPGKVKTDAQFAEARAAEAEAMQSMPRPPEWNAYGGWAAGPKLDTTGHFRTVKHEGKWYLVDPEGRLFFSIGMGVVQARGATPIDQRETWFADAPWEHEPALAGHVEQGREVARGEYKGQSPRVFGFYTANLQRKYGESWKATWLELMPRRLMNWGFNTVGNWSDQRLLDEPQLPYTHWVFYNTAKLPWRQGVRNRIPDPFHPSFETDLRRRTQAMTKGTTDDPYCIGYFVDNELSWGGETELAEMAILGDVKSHAKQAFLANLKAKYTTVDKFNAAWKRQQGAWDDFIANKDIPTTPEAHADLLTFNEKIARAYFETVRRVVKGVAPDKLYLGCRFAESNPQVVRVAAEYCDVVSFNLYRDTVAAWAPPAPIDKPVIIGEFHFGATDRGVFGPGLVRAGSTAERATKYRRYVSGAASAPLIVGAHWFQLTDEPTTGRLQDGENHGVGFISVTDTAYAEMIEASRAVASELYATRARTSTPQP